MGNSAWEHVIIIICGLGLLIAPLFAPPQVSEAGKKTISYIGLSGIFGLALGISFMIFGESKSKIVLWMIILLTIGLLGCLCLTLWYGGMTRTGM